MIITGGNAAVRGVTKLVLQRQHETAQTSVREQNRDDLSSRETEPMTEIATRSHQVESVLAGS